MSRILLVDDDASLLKLMSMRLRSQGYEVDTADSAEGALDRLRQQRADLVLSDLRMAGMDGLALFERIQSQWLGLPVIIMTAHGTIPDAIQATRSGVFSFLTKPIDKDELFATIEHALSLTRPKQRQEWQSLILTRNPQMEQLLIQASSIATMEVPVLIMGPSGSGKGVMTQALHQASSRRDQPLYVINCAALPWAALDLQLFGEDGQSGLFEQAKGATLFLDEIGDLSESLQAKLLQVLQEYGQGTPEVRVISSSHQDLVAAMEEGRFREDLFYRLNVANITMPPLSARSEDIPLLARQALDEYRSRHGECAALGFSPEALALLAAAAAWPGNVRQLYSVVEQLASLCCSPVIGAAMVESALSGGSGGIPSFNEARAEFEKEYLIRLLRTTEGNVTLAASMAGRNRTDFYKLLNRHGIEAANFKSKG
ncbi:sigma 54-interacting transcriptional regulator [Aeromonas dhakensis]|uniref:sigma 54-interacting transcriptional regulator n=4 Tax=Aeromonas dhakensis TaxID=196024 RepID=UPI002891A8AE|nr:sigma 54-interacting transcriptional regulator [Aeromonas dhakensis]MDX7698474.1 sigma 54-interacting transcriptional regulator [Aeromonas dhakensis]HDX8590609.1 sigma 54-interacting transcriptional regulator [Aeromonas dhakensis]